MKAKLYALCHLGRFKICAKSHAFSRSHDVLLRNDIKQKVTLLLNVAIFGANFKRPSIQKGYVKKLRNPDL